MTNCKYYKTSECDLRSCKHHEHPEHCYLYERAERLNLEDPRRRVTPNTILEIILETINKEEADTVWEALSMKN